MASQNLEASKCYILQPLNAVAVSGKANGVQVFKIQLINAIAKELVS
jgi:hypothetical protein